MGSSWVAHITGLDSDYILDTLCSRCLAVHSFCRCLYQKKSALTITGWQGEVYFYSVFVKCFGHVNSVLVECSSALWVVSHQVFYLPPHSGLHLIFYFSLLCSSLLPAQGKTHNDSNSFVLERKGELDVWTAREKPSSAALCHVCWSSGIPNTRACCNARQDSRIQTTSTRRPR